MKLITKSLRFCFLLFAAMLLSVMLVTGYVDDPAQGNVYYFDMEQGSGMDNYTGSYSMTDSGTSDISGKLGQARDFDGSSDEIDTNIADLCYAGDCTYNLWVYADDTSDRVPISANTAGDGTFIRRLPSTIDTRARGGTEPSTSLSPGTSSWYMLTLVVNGSNHYVYYNGVYQHSGTVGSQSARDIWIGANNQGADRWWNGRIDEVGMWDDALSPAAIATLYNSGDGFNPFATDSGIPVITDVYCSSCNDTISPYTGDDTTPTFKFNTSINANCRLGAQNVSYATMNSSRNCATTGTTAHTCSLTTQDEITESSATIYLKCVNILNSSAETGLDLVMDLPNLDSNASTRILAGITASSIGVDAQTFTDQQVFLRNANNDQVTDTVDYVVVYGDQRWIFNYDETTPVGLFNISPAVYVLDMYNVTLSSITSSVTNLIETTKR